MLAVLGTDRAGLAAREAGSDRREARRYGRALCRRCTGTPAAAPDGRAGVPAPRARGAVRACSSRAPRRRCSSTSRSRRSRGEAAPRVADACTGTGAIALAIAQEHPGAQRRRDGPARPRRSRWHARTPARSGLDVEVLLGRSARDRSPGRSTSSTCNPPYVPVERRDELPAEVLADPELAVFGGPAIVRAAVRRGARRACAPAASVVVEIEESTAVGDRPGSRRAAGFVDVATVR